MTNIYCISYSNLTTCTFKNNYLKSWKSPKWTHFMGPLKKRDEKATSAQLTTPLFLKDQWMHYFCKTTSYTFWILVRWKVESGKEEEIKTLLKSCFSAPRMMDDHFLCFKTVRKGKGGVPFTKENTGRVRNTQVNFTGIWITAVVLRIIWIIDPFSHL